MKEKILRIFGSLLLLAFISCSKSDVECNSEIIEAYAVEKCGRYAANEECKSEVVYLITTSCGIN